MSKNSNLPWRTISIILVAVVVISFSFSVYAYQLFLGQRELYLKTLENLEAVSYEVDVLVNYGEGRLEWFNDTRVPIGWNFYNVTFFISRGNIDAMYFPQFGAHLVNAIKGVGLNKPQAQKDWYWIAWQWDEEKKSWKPIEVGADLFAVQNKQVLAWYFEDTSTWPPKPPT